MVMKADKQRLRKVLLDAISLLCKNGLPVETEFCIEATIGITLNEDDVVLVSFKEIIKPDQVTMAGSSRVKSDLNERQLVDKEHILSLPAVENQSRNVDNNIIDIIPDIVNQIETNIDEELISDELKTEYEPFRVPEATPRSEICKRKRPYVYPTRMPMEETNLNTDSVVGDIDYRQTFRQSVSGQPKLRKRPAVNEEFVNDVPVTIKEETRGAIDNNYVKRENDGHIEWSGGADDVGQEDDSWMFQEVYELGGSAYNTSAYPASRQKSHHAAQQVKLDGDAGLSGRLSKTDTILQSWNTPDVMQTEESSASQTTSSKRQWTTTRNASSLDQNTVVQTDWITACQPLNLVKSTSSFTCETCGASFKYKCSLTEHIKNHINPYAYKCTICQKSFADRSTLVKHIRIHTGEKPYECQVCQQKFAQSGNLKRHERTFHGYTNNYFYTH